MARCEGTTKAGARCKRDAVEGSPFCATHRDRSAGGDGSRTARKGADLILIGAVALALLALRRVIRL